ncbi:MAG: cell division protein FtsA [Syntrophomonadaceae bacterium]
MDKAKVFALDIGTRKVVGLILEKSGDQFQVIDVEITEHSTRSMMNGQIHDVEAVAATILQVKEALQERLKIKLETASVAAAGRSLKTTRANSSKERSHANEISHEEIRALEIEAVQQAQYQLAQEELGKREGSNYFCTGYSIVRYYLEGQSISNLVGQLGKEIGVEVIATFLPRVVVDSLFSALRRAGLQINSLTLEPIAALSVAIPPALRLLNLALVDIGAGTSDIALVKEGNVFAYAMVAMAGDEITEYIASRYLLDFATAENVKRLLSSEEEVEIIDILGNRHIVSTRVLQEEIKPLLDKITSQIALNIINFNQNLPDAVICVGGGSLTPGLINSLADNLGIVAQRVGIRTIRNLDYIKTESDFLNGPQGVTPIGIGYNYYAIPPIPFIKVSVNGRETALWSIGKINVAVALINSGINLKNIYGKPGMGKTIEINGTIKVFKGGMGTPPVIKINGISASLDSMVEDGDSIEFAPGQDGEEASIKGSDLVGQRLGKVMVNNIVYQVKPVLTVNGQPYDLDMEIPDRAQVEIKSVNNVYNILRVSGLDKYWLTERIYQYYIKDKPIRIKWIPLEIRISGQTADINQEVGPEDIITYEKRSLLPCLNDLRDKLGFIGIKVNVNGEEVSLEGKGIGIEINGKAATWEDELFDGAHIMLKRIKDGAILSDIFQYIDIKPRVNGKLVIKVDGKQAGFTTPLEEGSKIEIGWQ